MSVDAAVDAWYASQTAVPENLLREAREVVTRFLLGYRVAPAVYFAAVKALPTDEQRAALEAWKCASITDYQSCKESLAAKPAPVRAQWEYHTQVFETFYQAESLSHLGEQGWELVGMLPAPAPGSYRFYFKRPRISE